MKPWSSTISWEWAMSASSLTAVASARESRRAGHARLGDLQERLVLGRARIVLREPEAEGRHVVHEEIGEMLGTDDDERIEARGLETPPQPLVGGEEHGALLLGRGLAAPGDAGGMDGGGGEGERHYAAPRSLARFSAAR